MTTEDARPGAIPLRRIVEVLHAHGVREFAFTGGIAVGVWASPRQTKDVDVCGALPLIEVDRLLAQRDGIRSGTEELPDLVRFRVGDWDVDLFVSKSAYDRECLSRAVETTIADVVVRVVTREDLLIHKMLKLRTDRRRIIQDLADLRALVTVGSEAMDWDHVNKWLEPGESRLIESIASANDEELLRRLFGTR